MTVKQSRTEALGRAEEGPDITNYDLLMTFQAKLLFVIALSIL